MSINIGGRLVGDEHPCYVIAEIGVNHQGSLDNCRKLIAAAALAGADAVKFQKRTVDVVYSPEELAKPRESVFGDTNGDLKRGLEFGKEEYKRIAMWCEEHGIQWFASCWDKESVDFIEQFDPPCCKIASASLTDHDLLRHTAATGKPLILSTGMSTQEEIDAAMYRMGMFKHWGSDGQPYFEANGMTAILHCTSTYPCPDSEINLRCIDTLRSNYPGIPIGYSGHEKGIATTVAAVALGACIAERHLTLDRTMWGSDQSASLEPHGFARMVRDIRAVEAAMGDGVKRVYESELPCIAKLRRVGAHA